MVGMSSKENFVTRNEIRKLGTYFCRLLVDYGPVQDCVEILITDPASIYRENREMNRMM